MLVPSCIKHSITTSRYVCIMYVRAFVLEYVRVFDCPHSFTYKRRLVCVYMHDGLCVRVHISVRTYLPTACLRLHASVCAQAGVITFMQVESFLCVWIYVRICML